MNALKLVSSNKKGLTVSKSKGFVLQHQSIDDQEWSDDPHCMLVAQYLIRKAAYSPHNRQYGKHSVDLLIGQFVTSYLNLAKLSAVYGLYKTSKNPEASAKSAIDRVLNTLAEDGFLTKVTLGKGKHQCSVITLKNWGKFQAKNVSFLKTNGETLNETQEKTNETQIHQGVEVNPKTNQETNQETLSKSNTNKVYKQQERLVPKGTCDQSASESRKKEDRTPYLKIIELYHQILPLHQTIRVFESHKQNIKARHRSMPDGLESWRKYFTFVAENCTWMASGQYPNAQKFAYLVNKANFEDIQNGGKNDRA